MKVNARPERGLEHYFDDVFLGCSLLGCVCAFEAFVFKPTCVCEGDVFSERWVFSGLSFVALPVYGELFSEEPVEEVVSSVDFPIWALVEFDVGWDFELAHHVYEGGGGI